MIRESALDADCTGVKKLSELPPIPHPKLPEKIG
jgi:hypothetical protein